MPVANRYVLPGSACHLTHRCHDRKFLLRFKAHRQGREAQWTDSIAVGSQEFVNGVADANEWRAKLEIRRGEGGSWLVREAEEPYGRVPAGAEAGKGKD
ncbi:MAG TPA: hypothetical protein PK280_07995 [Planctomycetota bacterium]|nr:hypothetical protein [Planctomycetota bacterium]